jgi:hypothetical protein
MRQRKSRDISILSLNEFEKHRRKATATDELAPRGLHTFVGSGASAFRMEVAR